jgi:hypothetical protein
MWGIEMDQVTFSLPTLTTASMSRQDQIDVSTNQAVAVIVSNWLEYSARVLEASNSGLNLSGPTIGELVVTSAELVTIINNVQAALRTIA